MRKIFLNVSRCIKTTKQGRKMDEHLVFCYGTLKKNEPNQCFMDMAELGKAIFISSGSTKELFPLIISSRFQLPFLLDKEKTGKHVQGEVYRIDNTRLAWLDDFEDHPDVYNRRQITISLQEPVDGKSELECWTYMLREFPPKLLKCKPFLEVYTHSTHTQGYTIDEDDIAPHNVYEELEKEAEQCDVIDF